LNLTIKFYILLTIFFAAATIVSVYVVSAPPIQNPPKGPLEIGVGPCPEATRNGTELLIDIPARTIDVRVTFRFNETKKYFIYALLPYTIEQATPYAIHHYVWYPLQIPDFYPEIGNFSRNFMNTNSGSSIVNATLEFNPDFQFNFWQPDLKDQLTIGVSVKVHESLIAIRDSFGASQSVIFTFFGDTTGMMTDEMYVYKEPLSQLTIGDPFIVHLRLPPSSYYSDSQPSPIQYYVKQDQRWSMFSLNFIEGRYAQTLRCDFTDPVGQSSREIGIFLIGVFSTLSISFGIEAVSRYIEGKETEQGQKTAIGTPPSPSEQQPPDIKKLINLVDTKFEENLAKIRVRNVWLMSTLVIYILLFSYMGYLLWFVAQVAIQGIGQVPIENSIAFLIALTTSLIAFMSLAINITKAFSFQEGYKELVEHNFKKLKDQATEAEKPLLKALIMMKSKHPEFDLKNTRNKRLFDESRLLQRLYE
jgi:hypothetical protein